MVCVCGRIIQCGHLLATNFGITMQLVAVVANPDKRPVLQPSPRINIHGVRGTHIHRLSRGKGPEPPVLPCPLELVPNGHPHVAFGAGTFKDDLLAFFATLELASIRLQLKDITTLSRGKQVTVIDAGHTALMLLCQPHVMCVCCWSFLYRQAFPAGSS